MKYCSKCHTKVMGSLIFCPLCQHELQIKDTKVEDLYPTKIQKRTNKYMLLKIFGFISSIVSIIAIFFNLILPSKTLWSLCVVGIMGFVWLSISVAIRKHRDILKYLWYQMLIISSLAVFVDMMTGHRGWSITFVVPILLTTGMLAMYLLSKILHLQVGDYMIYLLMDALFGLIPCICLTTGKLSTNIPSQICILTSIISVIGLVIFEGKNMMSELKRRLHI
ncbi:MAG: hypothetical protein E7231_16985 [Cellulosilyticum sp.]|nr:hypothetical protein [Cellulosilyticum sp.]